MITYPVITDQMLDKFAEGTVAKELFSQAEQAGFDKFWETLAKGEIYQYDMRSARLFPEIDLAFYLVMGYNLGLRDAAKGIANAE